LIPTRRPLVEPPVHHGNDDESSDPEISSDDDEIIPPGLAEKRSCRGFPITVSQLDIRGLAPTQIQLLTDTYDLAGDSDAQVQTVARAFRTSDRPIAFEQIGKIFRISRRTVFHHLSGDDWSDKSRRWPSLLSENDMLKMRACLIDQYNKKTL
jgi:hypothetical protein